MDFRTNSWYRLTTAASMETQLSLAGTPPYRDDQDGMVTFGPSDNKLPMQQWQIFSVDVSTFLLRTKASGPSGYLAVETNNGSDAEAVPRMYNHAETDNTMLWKIVPWGDGTFYFSNVINGNSCHLDFKGADGVVMSTNMTQPQPGQAFSFVRLGNIDDEAFSTVQTPLPSTATSELISTVTAGTATVGGSALDQDISTTSKPSTTLASHLSSPTSTPSSAPPQQHLHRLSSSAAMGIGASIGVLGLIFLTSFVLFVYQQWRKRRSPETLHYRRAKLWKGFTPQERVSKISVGSSKSIGEVYVAELPEPTTPSAVLSSPMTERHFSWQSWHTGSPPFSPFIALTPTSPLVELPV